MATRLSNVMALGTLSVFFVTAERLTDYDRSRHLAIALETFLRGILRDFPATDPPVPRR